MPCRFRFSRQVGQDNKYSPGGGRRGVGRIDGTRGPRSGNLRESPVTFSHQVIDLAHATLVEGVCAVDSCHPRPSEAGRVKGQNQLPLRTPPQHPSLAGCDGYSTQHLASVGGRRYRLQPPSRRGGAREQFFELFTHILALVEPLLETAHTRSIYAGRCGSNLPTLVPTLGSGIGFSARFPRQSA